MVIKKKKPKKGWDAKTEHKQSNGRRGNPNDWAKAAKILLRARGDKNEYCELLGLEHMPESQAELKKAYRKTMLRVHPDQGGTDEAARMAIAAFELLMENF